METEAVNRLKYSARGSHIITNKPGTSILTHTHTHTSAHNTHTLASYTLDAAARRGKAARAQDKKPFHLQVKQMQVRAIAAAFMVSARLASSGMGTRVLEKRLAARRRERERGERDSLLGSRARANFLIIARHMIHTARKNLYTHAHY